MKYFKTDTQRRKATYVTAYTVTFFIINDPINVVDLSERQDDIAPYNT